jgi:hypothetical protein
MMMMTASDPPDPKQHLTDADQVVDALPWKVGSTAKQHKMARGRASALAHQIAAQLAGGWSVEQIRAELSDAPQAGGAPDPAAQERLWRAALKRAKNARQHSPADSEQRS